MILIIYGCPPCLPNSNIRLGFVCARAAVSSPVRTGANTSATLQLVTGCLIVSCVLAPRAMSGTVLNSPGPRWIVSLNETSLPCKNRGVFHKCSHEQRLQSVTYFDVASCQPQEPSRAKASIAVQFFVHLCNGRRRDSSMAVKNGAHGQRAGPPDCGHTLVAPEVCSGPAARKQFIPGIQSNVPFKAR